RRLPFLSALVLSTDVLSGHAHLDVTTRVGMAAEAPWADLVAMDLTLDQADLPSAKKIATTWGSEAESQPLRALRLARLARYEGRLDAADALSLVALERGTVTPRVLWERAYVLVARGRASDVGALLGHYPLVLGPVATWVSAYAAGAAGNVEAAKGRTATVDPPVSAAPLGARVVAASAFGAMKEKRRGSDYVKAMLSTGCVHPDLVAAAAALGLRRSAVGVR
ncbi:MAG: hypothetical protein M3O50_13285, partial [Myxococcota bacterium]|nr:hypothetical protein [Myxococcota bacterium]